jgi:hypothetical protein
VAVVQDTDLGNLFQYKSATDNTNTPEVLQFLNGSVSQSSPAVVMPLNGWSLRNADGTELTPVAGTNEYAVEKDFVRWQLVAPDPDNTVFDLGVLRMHMGDVIGLGCGIMPDGGWESFVLDFDFYAGDAVTMEGNPSAGEFIPSVVRAASLADTSYSGSAPVLKVVSDTNGYLGIELVGDNSWELRNVDGTVLENPQYFYRSEDAKNFQLTHTATANPVTFDVEVEYESSQDHGDYLMIQVKQQ